MSIRKWEDQYVYRDFSMMFFWSKLFSFFYLVAYLQNKIKFREYRRFTKSLAWCFLRRSCLPVYLQTKGQETSYLSKKVGRDVKNYNFIWTPSSYSSAFSMATTIMDISTESHFWANGHINWITLLSFFLDVTVSWQLMQKKYEISRCGIENWRKLPIPVYNN
jgi:hypothetical protein